MRTQAADLDFAPRFTLPANPGLAARKERLQIEHLRSQRDARDLALDPMRAAQTHHRQEVLGAGWTADFSTPLLCHSRICKRDFLRSFVAAALRTFRIALAV